MNKKANPLSGICFDTYIISNEEYVGLSSLKFISYKTGGNLIFYPDKQNCGLPQDMYIIFVIEFSFIKNFSCVRYLYYSKPLAFRGMLRLRTSTPFKSKYSFGNLFPDLTYNDIYHLPGCDIFKTFTFDFEFCDTQFGE